MHSLRLLAIIFIILSSPAVSAQQQRPNIVLIVADDHGREAVGAYGNSVVKTPNIDALAREGTLFSNAFCTTASCSPSRSVILSGRNSHANGMYGLQHAEHHFQSFNTVQSLPVLLKTAGYRTARTGKFHVAPDDVYKFDQILLDPETSRPASGSNPVSMAEGCRAFVADKTTEPFFLYFATTDPHRSSVTANEGKSTTESFNVPTAPNSFGNHRSFNNVATASFEPGNVIVPSYLPDTKQCRLELAEYYASIARLDQGVGKLLQVLRETGVYEKTVIIYISDNGAPFPGAKTSLYEPGIRLPLIIKLPIPKRRNFVQDAMVSWVDLTPTILDFAGLKSGMTFDGRSFRSIIEQSNVAGWDEVYGSHTFHEVTMYYPMRMIRQRQFKLIYNIAWQLPFPVAADLHASLTWQSTLKENQSLYGKRLVRNFTQRPKFELYDLQNDPDELINLADNPAYQKQLEELKRKLKEFQLNTNDKWVHKWDYE